MVCCSHNCFIAGCAINARRGRWRKCTKPAPKHTCSSGLKVLAVSHGSGSEQTQGGMFWGCWSRKEGGVALQFGFCIFSVLSFLFSLQKRIAECRYWPVEVCGMSVASSGKGKTSKADKVKVGRDMLFWLVEQHCVIEHFPFNAFVIPNPALNQPKRVRELEAL